VRRAPRATRIMKVKNTVRYEHPWFGGMNILVRHAMATWEFTVRN